MWYCVILFSFGFKYGLLMDVDFVVDMWFFLNLFWNEELCGLIG